MSKKLRLVYWFLLLFCSTHLLGQQIPNPEPAYRTSLGVKLGTKVQLSAKAFVGRDMAFDVSAGYIYDDSSPSVSMVFEYHHDTYHNNFFWYYGGGPAMVLKRNRSQIGFSTVIGTEMVTKEKLINIFMEAQPTVLTRINSFTFGPSQELNFELVISVGTRYIFS